MVSKIDSSVSKVYLDPDFNSLLKESAKDGRINKTEANQLKEYIQKTNLPDTQKEELSGFIDALSNSTTENKRFLFSSTESTKNLTSSDINQLRELSKNNKIAQEILLSIIDSQTKNIDSSEIDKSLKTNSNSNTAHSLSFVEDVSHSENSDHQDKSIIKSKFFDSFPDWYKTQFTASDLNLIKEGRFKEVKNADCGPTSASMVLRANNFTVPDNDQIRKDMKINHKHAISTEQLSGIVKKYSNGQIKQTFKNSYNANNMEKMVNDLRSELLKGRIPVLLTSAMSANNGHYTVVTAVKENGNILVADPSNPSNMREYEKDDFLEAMKRRDQKKMPNTIISFSKE